VRRQRDGRRPHIAQVGLADLALGRPYAQEVDRTEAADLGERPAEPEPAGFQVLPQQRFQAGFEERDLTLRGLGDLLFVDVDRQHVVAEVRHADRVGEAEVSGPDDSNPRQLTPPPVAASDTVARGPRDADVLVAGSWPMLKQ
jgi:hypothetical protein